LNFLALLPTLVKILSAVGDGGKIFYELSAAAVKRYIFWQIFEHCRQRDLKFLSDVGDSA
jgi:hypothetical protein